MIMVRLKAYTTQTFVGSKPLTGHLFCHTRNLASFLRPSSVVCQNRGVPESSLNSRGLPNQSLCLTPSFQKRLAAIQSQVQTDLLAGFHLFWKGREQEVLLRAYKESLGGRLSQSETNRDLLGQTKPKRQKPYAQGQNQRRKQELKEGAAQDRRSQKRPGRKQNIRMTSFQQSDALNGSSQEESLQPKTKKQKIGSKRKAPFTSKEIEIKCMIETAARNNDPHTAFKAFDQAKSEGIKVHAATLNTLLYICAGGDAWQKKFQHFPVPWSIPREIWHTSQKKSNKNKDEDNKKEPAKQDQNIENPVVEVSASELRDRAESILTALKEAKTTDILSEMTYTGMSRLRAAGGDAQGSFEAAIEGLKMGVPTRLRTFLPSLLAFTEEKNFEGALKVVTTLLENGVDLTEIEHAALILACQYTSDRESIEKILNRIGAELTHLQPETILATETYFRSENAKRILPDGQEWKIERCLVDKNGKPGICSENLQVVDLNEEDWQEFEDGIVELALSKEREPDGFKTFQEFLEKNGPFTRIIDAANIAYFGQNFAQGHFQFSQIGDVVETILQEEPDEKPLVILHKKRTKDLPAQKDEAQALLKSLNDENLLYGTPYGSNDDWYWIYATVKAGKTGLIISNDEMRDHIFQMLTPKYYLKWKENHQMKYKFKYEGLELYRPPQYTACVQKLKDGSWLFPIAESEEWLCAKPVQIE